MTLDQSIKEIQLKKKTHGVHIQGKRNSEWAYGGTPVTDFTRFINIKNYKNFRAAV